MNQHSRTKGFTFIELIVVMALMAILIALSAPFVASLQSDIAMQRNLRQVKVDLVSIISYSLAGKSFAALSADDLMDPKNIPAAYALYFETDTDYGDQTSYRYMEFTAEEDGLNQAMELSYDIPHEYVSPAVYLKELNLINSITGTSQSVNSAYIVVVPPFGKILFVNKGENFITGLSADGFYQDQKNFDEIELHFQYKDDELSETVISLNQSKIININ